MKLAYIHQLPLEIYPPATNALRIFVEQPGWEVRAWTIANPKGLPTFALEGAIVRRPDYPGANCGSAKRLLGFLRWHFSVARELARWRPDAILSIEPHSALAIWIYYRIFGGDARLFIHHHEYYAPIDFLGPGSRTSRLCHYFEKSDLFNRAEWISQTNEARLRLMQADCATVTLEKGKLWPNYPDVGWISRAKKVSASSKKIDNSPLRLIYVGSLSFEDTFIREFVEWVVLLPQQVNLHICGHNVRSDVWEWIDSLGVSHISTNPAGCAYDELPDLLTQFDVALVLYKGNTLNFIHNVPNKAVEALACGLEVWYPPEMQGMIDFQKKYPALPLRKVNFRQMDSLIPMPLERHHSDLTLFSAEQAITPLLKSLSPEIQP